MPLGTSPTIIVNIDGSSRVAIRTSRTGFRFGSLAFGIAEMTRRAGPLQVIINADRITIVTFGATLAIL